MFRERREKMPLKDFGRGLGENVVISMLGKRFMQKNVLKDHINDLITMQLNGMNLQSVTPPSQVSPLFLELM